MIENACNLRYKDAYSYLMKNQIASNLGDRKENEPNVYTEEVARESNR
jgi:hypothetical protein